MAYLTEAEMFERSFQRPADFFELGPEARWAIDKSLGILDWDGILTADERKRYEAHYDYFKRKNIETALREIAEKGGQELDGEEYDGQWARIVACRALGLAELVD